jgi:hypothetical protein
LLKNYQETLEIHTNPYKNNVSYNIPIGSSFL